MEAHWNSVLADYERTTLIANAIEGDAEHEAALDAAASVQGRAIEALLTTPAPDGAALALKVMIAIGKNRASIPYQNEIEADARRLADMEALS